MTDRARKTPKSIRTREAIEIAARHLFSINGFDRTTVREIGAHAGIDPSMIIRYFGSKDALFTHVATPNLQLTELANVKSTAIGEAIVRHFLQIWEGEQGGGGMQVLLRSAASNNEAAERMRAIFISQVIPAMARIRDDKTAIVRAGLVASQLIGLAMTRYVLRVPPVVAMTPDFIIRNIGKTIQRYATAETSLDQ